MVQDKVRYAGKTYEMQREATEHDIKKQEQKDKLKLGGHCGALD